MAFKGETLVVKRKPVTAQEEGSDEIGWTTEIITHEWHDYLDVAGSLHSPRASLSLQETSSPFGPARA